MSTFDGSPEMRDLLENFDVILQEFYKVVFQKMIEKKGVAKKEMVSILKKSRKIRNSSSLNSTLLHWTAYLFRYSACYTSATTKHMVRMVSRNPSIFRDILGKESVRICCLGGNLALEAVALSRTILSVQDLFWPSTHRPLHLRITAIDKNRFWKGMALDLIETLTETEKMFDSSKIVLSFEFRRANFLKFLENDVVESLREADIVTMVNAMDPRMPLTKLSSFVQDISANMKDGAVLFYLNTGSNMQWRRVEESLSKDVKCIYEPVQLEAFTLNLNSIQRCVSLFWHDYNQICLTSCIVNACAWIKTTDANYLQLRRINLRKTKLRRKEKAEESQRILDEFHSKVLNIVPKKTLKRKELKELNMGSYLTGDLQDVFKKNILFSTKGKHRRIPF